MMKSVFAKLARAPSARHFSSYPKGRGNHLPSSHSPEASSDMTAIFVVTAFSGPIIYVVYDLVLYNIYSSRLTTVGKERDRLSDLYTAKYEMFDKKRHEALVKKANAPWVHE